MVASRARLPTLLAALLACTACAPTTAQTPRPNLLFILTDDQRADAVGVYKPALLTPHLDHLARDGVRFDNAFVTSPICPSSRATLLTGLYEEAHHFTFDRPPLSQGFLERSYPKLLRDAGYRTGFFGKNGAQLDENAAALLFDTFVPIFRSPYLKEQSDGSLVHASDLIAAAAIDFIAAAPPGVPLSLTVWFNAPHPDPDYPEVFIPPVRFNDLYSDLTFPVPASSDPEFFAQLPQFLQESLNREEYEAWWTPASFQEMSRRYQRMIAGVDDAVGQIESELEKRGLAQGTVIVFMSDNGFYIGERGFGGKWLAHEPSIRVPLFIYDPRRPEGERGRVVEELVLNTDIPETLLELAGVAPPADAQGRSLVPFLVGETPTLWRRDLYLEHTYVPAGRAEIPRHDSLRTERFKLIRYRDHDYVELYDLEGDPEEVENLAERPEYEILRTMLSARLDELKSRWGGGIFADGFESGDTAHWQPLP